MHQAVHAVHDGDFFVERGHDHGERLGQISRVDEIEILDEVGRYPATHLPGRECDQPEGVRVVEQEVDQEHRLDHQREQHRPAGERLYHGDAGRLRSESSSAPATRCRIDGSRVGPCHFPGYIILHESQGERSRQPVFLRWREYGLSGEGGRDPHSREPPVPPSARRAPAAEQAAFPEANGRRTLRLVRTYRCRSREARG